MYLFLFGFHSFLYLFVLSSVVSICSNHVVRRDFLKLINVHDLFIFCERTAWRSSFKRFEYFVLKKEGKNTFH